MKVWACANQKGGVGKTTTAVTLAGLLAARGYKTLLVDMDPHGSLSAYFGYDPDNNAQSLYQLFQQAKDPSAVQRLIGKTRFNHLSIVPASAALATLDRQLGAQEGMGLILANALAWADDLFDYALLDCPPVLGVLMVNALAACERLLIPVQTEFLALKGLERMLHTLDMIGRARRLPLQHTIVPTLFDRRTRAALDSVQALRERHGNAVWRGEIPVDTQFREASRRGVPLPLAQPGARGALAYAELLDTLLDADHAARYQALAS
ncbi:MAG: ParA family protein [Pseudomonadota bacterium]